jgi:leucyl-tRNA synthetase
MPVYTVNNDITLIEIILMHTKDKAALKAKIIASHIARRDIAAAAERKAQLDDSSITSALTTGVAALATFIPHLFIKAVETVNDDTLIGSKIAEGGAAKTVDAVADSALYMKGVTREQYEGAKSRMAENKLKLDILLGNTPKEEPAPAKDLTEADLRAELETKLEALRIAKLKKKLADIEKQIADSK